MGNSVRVAARQKPFINVTPLIDVLLVLLIIFMVVSPLKQSRFTAQIPEPKDKKYPQNLPLPPDMLLVTIGSDHGLTLNSTALGTVEDTTLLSAKLSEVFAQRMQNRAYRWDLIGRTDLPEGLRIQKTVFIRAPRALQYGDVVKVIDGIKLAGGAPIGLQLDDLN